MTTPLIGACRAVCVDFMPAEMSADLAAIRTARLLATVLEQRSVPSLSMRSLSGSIELKRRPSSIHRGSALDRLIAATRGPFRGERAISATFGSRCVI